MKFLLLFLFSLLLLFFQISGIDSINISILKISFSYVIALSIIVSLNNKNIYQSIIFSVLVGLIIDLYNASPSFYFINLGIMTIIINNISNKISFSSIYLFIIISFSTFFIEIINATLIGFFYYGFESDLISYQIFKDNIISYIIGNNIVGYILNLFFKSTKNS